MDRLRPAGRLAAARGQRHPRRVLRSQTIAARWRFYVDLFGAASRPPCPAPRSRTSTRSSSAAPSRCTSPVRGSSASSGAACRRGCNRPGPRRRCPGPRSGPGVSVAGGSSLVLFRALAPPGRGLEADRVPVAPRAAGALLAAHRRSAGAPRGVADTALANDPAGAGVRAAAQARRLDAQGAGVGADLDEAPRPGRVGDPRRRSARLGARGARPRRGPHPREAALDAVAREAGAASGTPWRRTRCGEAR